MRKFLVVLTIIIPVLLLKAQECDIPNGDFELWAGDKPNNWGTTNVADQMTVPQMQGVDLRSVFKSTDSRSGMYSLHLKNASLLDALKSHPGWEQMSQIPQIKKQIEEQFKMHSLSASVYWCSGDCDADLLAQNTKGFENKVSFPVEKTPRAICGYYKTSLKGGDKLWINPFLITSDGGAGGPKADDTQAVITENTSKWKKFKIPLYVPEGKEVSSAGVQFFIVGSKFPNVPPYGLGGMRVGMSVPGNEGSEVWIDDVCFCDNIEIDIWNAELLDGKQIEPGIKLSEGAQTVENFDNDDEDKFFDYNPKIKKVDDDVRDDDELVKIRLRIPHTGDEREQIFFETTKGKENVQIWRHKSKRERFYNTDSLFIPDDFTKVDGVWEKILWVEGIEAHTEQQGTIFKVSRESDPEVFDEAALTVIGIESIEWEGIGNSINHDNKLDYDVNFRNHNDPVVQTHPCNCDELSESTSSLKPGGVRVFPGKRIIKMNTVEKERRDKVKAKVTLSVEPVRPIKLYFESFDVDDPTISGSAIDGMDNESSHEDNLGFVEAFGKKIKSGTFTGEGKDGILEEEFTNKEQKLEFKVSMQPGDNFRVVGAFDKKFLETLRNDDHKLKTGRGAALNNNKQLITHQPVFDHFPKSPKEAGIRLPDNYSSKVLTVWRYAYAEVDKMGPIGISFVSTGIVSYQTNTPDSGQTYIELFDNLIEEVKKDGLTEATKGSHHPNLGMENAFQEGEFSLGPGYPKYPILYNSAKEDGGSDNVTINGILPEGLRGKPCGLSFDDHLAWDFKTGDEMPDLNPDMCVLERIFRPAYIRIDFDAMNNAEINPNTETEFKRNTNADDYNAIKSNYKFDNRSLAANEDFWCFYVNTCFKGGTAEDGDPDKVPDPIGSEQAITGVADDEKLGINIFMEGLLEFNGFDLCTRPNVGSGKGDVIAHEIAHLFGGEHEDKAIMNITSNKFAAITISKIRKSKHP